MNSAVWQLWTNPCMQLCHCESHDRGSYLRGTSYLSTGKSAGRLRDNDALEDVLSLMAHDTLLFLSSSGRAFSVKAHKVPEASRTAAGTAVSQVRARCCMIVKTTSGPTQRP